MVYVVFKAFYTDLLSAHSPSVSLPYSCFFVEIVSGLLKTMPCFGLIVQFH